MTVTGNNGLRGLAARWGGAEGPGVLRGRRREKCEAVSSSSPSACPLGPPADFAGIERRGRRMFLYLLRVSQFLFYCLSQPMPNGILTLSIGVSAFSHT